MEEKKIEGKIIFVQYEKKFVTIEYIQNGKTKTVNGSIKEEHQQKLKKEKLIKKLHFFREGDEVSFVLVRSVRGDKMVADQIQFRFNNSFSALLNKAATENRFTGYLKQVDDKYFIKEIESYHFFPLKLSAFETEPSADALNVPVVFKLENFSNPEKVSASLFHPKYIPEYKKAQYYFENKKALECTVTKITPHGIYINLVDNLQVKLSLEKDEPIPESGEKIKVIITWLSPDRIVVKKHEP
jgi:hypothetical protein